MLQREVARSEYGQLFGLLEQSIPESLEGLMSDLDELLQEPVLKPIKKTTKSDDPNPFVALFSWFKTSSDQSESIFTEPLRPDTEVEKVLRSFALLEARRLCREVYVAQKDRLRMGAEDAQL